MEVLAPFDEPALRRQVVFRDIDAARVRRRVAVKVGVLLQRRLSFAREKPIDEYARGVRMRPAFDEADRAAAARDVYPLFPFRRIELLDRQPLPLRPRGVAAGETDGEFSARKPIGHLTAVAAEGEIHRAEKPLDE